MPACMSVCMYVRMSVYMSVSLFLCMPVCLSASSFVPLSVRPSKKPNTMIFQVQFAKNLPLDENSAANEEKAASLMACIGVTSGTRNKSTQSRESDGVNLWLLHAGVPKKYPIKHPKMIVPNKNLLILNNILTDFLAFTFFQ